MGGEPSSSRTEQSVCVDNKRVEKVVTSTDSSSNSNNVGISNKISHNSSSNNRYTRSNVPGNNSVTKVMYQAIT